MILHSLGISLKVTQGPGISCTCFSSIVLQEFPDIVILLF